MKDRFVDIEVYGWRAFRFEEGWCCGPMKRTGISLCPIDESGMVRAGGSFSRGDAENLRNFLNDCLCFWDGENDPESQD